MVRRKGEGHWDLAQMSIGDTMCLEEQRVYFVLLFYNEAGFNDYRRYRWPRHFDSLGITRVEPEPAGALSRLDRWLRSVFRWPGK